MGKCIRCDVELVADGNWPISCQKQKQYKCHACYKEQIRSYAPHFNKTRMYVNGKYIPKTHPLYKPGRYKTFSDAAFDGTYKLESIKEGYVYAITNPAWPEWVKIGMAIDAEDRLNGYQTSSPMRDYQLVHAIATPDRARAERVAHKAAALCGERQGEWFKIANEEAVTILQHIKETEDEQKRESTN